MDTKGHKSKAEFPYNYDPIVQFMAEMGPEQIEGTTEYTTWSDRLLTYAEDARSKHDDLCVKHFGNRGQYWDQREPQKIQEFLRDYFESTDLLLTKVVEHCNQATGYPCWQFFYRKGLCA